MPRRTRESSVLLSLLLIACLIAEAVWFAAHRPKLSAFLGFQPFDDFGSKFVLPIPSDRVGAAFRHMVRSGVPAEHGWDQCLHHAKRKMSWADCRDGRWIRSAIALYRILPEPLPPPPPRPAKPRITAPLPFVFKMVNGRRVCNKDNDKPSKSRKYNYRHMDMECCLDPDEFPNPHCYYPPEKYGKYL